MESPVRYPDLTPLELFLRGFLKSKVYTTVSNIAEVLKLEIVDDCSTIPARTGTFISGIELHLLDIRVGSVMNAKPLTFIYNF